MAIYRTDESGKRVYRNTLTRMCIARRVNEVFPELCPTRCKRIVNVMVDAIIKGINPDSRVEIRGLGSFFLSDPLPARKATWGDIPARRNIKFKPSTTLKKRFTLDGPNHNDIG